MTKAIALCVMAWVMFLGLLTILRFKTYRRTGRMLRRAEDRVVEKLTAGISPELLKSIAVLRMVSDKVNLHHA